VDKPIETRAEFQQLAEARVEEAKTLLDAGKWDGAYYLAGYAVELALKACIIKKLMATDAFPKKDFSKDCYTHSVETLVGVAGLNLARGAATTADPVLSANWGTVKDWSEQSRHCRFTEVDARALYAAIADATHGVLSWIKTQW